MEKDIKEDQDMRSASVPVKSGLRRGKGKKRKTCFDKIIEKAKKEGKLKA